MSKVESTIELIDNGDYPPAVVVKEDGKIKMTWNFVYDYHDGTYWAEASSLGGFHKCKYLGKDEKKAKALYNSDIVHGKGA